MPEAYGIKSFRKENLPILPPVFTLIPRQIKEGKGYKADAAAVAQLKIIENSSGNARALSSPPMQDGKVS